jgi:tetratricopeptide (TPR) repeat protein
MLKPTHFIVCMAALFFLGLQGCQQSDMQEPERLLNQSFDLPSETEVLVAREQILAQYPQSAAAAYVQSWLRLRSGDAASAMKIADSLVKALPKYAIGYYARANCRPASEFEASIADFAKAIKLAPDFVPAYLNRGSAYFAKQMYAEARADFETIVRKNPQHAVARLNLGNVWFTKGELDQACEQWEQAVQNGNPKAKELSELYCH